MFYVDPTEESDFGKGVKKSQGPPSTQSKFYTISTLVLKKKKEIVSF